jgi:hypothetical protein
MITFEYVHRWLRPAEVFRMCFYALIIGVAIIRGTQGAVSIPDLNKLSLNLSVVEILGLIVLITAWRYSIYEAMIIPVKDHIAKKFGVENYRHWIVKLAAEKGHPHVVPEELYGYLKWECKQFSYPKHYGALISPSLNALYMLPVAWLITLYWVPSIDWVVIVAVIMIPGSFAADIAWERIETATFKRQKSIVEREIERISKG